VDQSDSSELMTQMTQLPDDDTPAIAPPSHVLPMNEIPVAVREAPVASPKRASRSPRLWLWGLGGALAAFAIIAVPMVLLSANSAKTSQPNLAANPTSSAQPPRNVSGAVAPEATSPPAETNGEPDQLLKHFKYDEAPQGDLQAISSDGGIKLRRVAAEKYEAMVDAAQADGVSLVSISGFRSMGDQDQLFFETGAARGQVPEQRAAVSAPPGYSEHHTGYAIDIGDGSNSETNLSQSFDQTKAYQWLKANAARYSFELSFPKNNEQGVSYEPWHWRFVGDRDSLKTFYRARNSKK
jgi:zinc D-Ala-D-Ala carboxypeptidase